MDNDKLENQSAAATPPGSEGPAGKRRAAGRSRCGRKRKLDEPAFAQAAGRVKARVREGQSAAAAAAAEGLGRSSFFERVGADPQLREEFRQARLTQPLVLIETEATRRAVDGTPRTVYYRGEPVGVKFVYSDSLLIMLLAAKLPEKYGKPRKAAAPPSSAAKRRQGLEAKLVDMHYFVMARRGRVRQFTRNYQLTCRANGEEPWPWAREFWLREAIKEVRERTHAQRLAAGLERREPVFVPDDAKERMPGQPGWRNTPAYTQGYTVSSALFEPESCGRGWAPLPGDPPDLWEQACALADGWMKSLQEDAWRAGVGVDEDLRASLPAPALVEWREPPEIAQARQQAERLEEAAYWRAIKGVEQPVYQGGEQVGSQTVYSDRLLKAVYQAELRVAAGAEGAKSVEQRAEERDRVTFDYVMRDLDAESMWYSFVYRSMVKVNEWRAELERAQKDRARLAKLGVPEYRAEQTDGTASPAAPGAFPEDLRKLGFLAVFSGIRFGEGGVCRPLDRAW